LVYGATVLPKEEPVPLCANEWVGAVAVVVVIAALNILFWQAKIGRWKDLSRCRTGNYAAGVQ